MKYKQWLFALLLLGGSCLNQAVSAEVLRRDDMSQRVILELPPQPPLTVPSTVPVVVVEKSQAVVIAQSTPPTDTHIVRKGETLSTIAPRNWQTVCRINNLPDCNRIRVGQTLLLSPQKEIMVAMAVNTASAKTLTLTARNTVLEKKKDCQRDVQGYCAWKVVGGNPFRGSDELAWKQHGLNAQEILELKGLVAQKQFTWTQFVSGDRFESVSFGKNEIWHKVRADWGTLKPGTAIAARQYTLSTGKVIAEVLWCGNWVIPVSLPKPEAPPLVPEVSLLPLPVEASVLEEKSKRCPIDPKLVVGQEHEPKHSSNDAHSTFFSAAVYCTWRGEHGTHGVGIGTQNSWWNGKVNSGDGKFKGKFLTIGPAYEYISDYGWDSEVKLLVGKLDESFTQGDYESDREFGMFGPSLSYNNYKRRMAGEKLFPETQVFGTLMFPFSRDISHSWQGRPIEDTDELSKLDLYFNAGVRQWLYEGKWFNPYIQLGYFLEKPGAESGSARIGIADPHRICGVGVGYDHDFIAGGNVQAWGWWCDAMRGEEVYRTHKRGQQIIDTTGAVVTSNGFVMVPVTPKTQ